MNDDLITPIELKALPDEVEQDGVQLIDVRTIEKHQTFNIGGKLISAEELPVSINELDPSKLVVTYCTSGDAVCAL